MLIVSFEMLYELYTSALVVFDSVDSVSRQLPSVNKLAKDIDVDSLESSLSLLSSKYTKKTTTSSKSETSPHAAVASPRFVLARLSHVLLYIFQHFCVSWFVK